MTKLNNRGFVLLGSLFIMLFLSVLLGTSLLRSEMQLRTVNNRVALQEAFYAAEAGVEQGVFQLRRNPDWRPGDGEQDPAEGVLMGDGADPMGSYSVTVLDDNVEYRGWKTLLITSVGQDSLQRVTKSIGARVLIESPARFLVSTMGDLRIMSGATIDADVLAQDLYFDINESLDSPEKDITMTGDYIYYTDTINGEDNDAVHIDPDTRVEQSPTVTFAGVNVDQYRELAEAAAKSGSGIFEEGNYTVDLDSMGDSIAIIYAEEDITVSGTYGHSLLVVAGGNIYIDGDIEADGSVEVRPQLGLFANKDVIIPMDAVPLDGDLTIEALVVADGDGEDAQGEFKAEGDRFSLGTLTFTGAMSVRGGGRTGVDLNAFKDRDYSFNPALNNNRSIPFTPFIVNIIEWQETTFHPEEEEAETGL